MKQEKITFKDLDWDLKIAALGGALTIVLWSFSLLIQITIGVLSLN